MEEIKIKKIVEDLIDTFLQAGKLSLDLRKKGLTKKIGVSIYDFDVLEKILNKFKFNLIQAPFNVLDQRLIVKNIKSIILKK